MDGTQFLDRGDPVDPEERIDRHGRTLAEHGVKIEVAQEDIGQLWKQKVSVDRYIWVERVVVASVGAVLYWAFQVLSK